MDTLGRLLFCFGLIVGPTSTSLSRKARTPDASSLVALGTVRLRVSSAEHSSNRDVGLQRRDPLHAANGTARVLAIPIVSILRCHVEPYTAGRLGDCSPITPTWNPSPWLVYIYWPALSSEHFLLRHPHTHSFLPFPRLWSLPPP